MTREKVFKTVVRHSDLFHMVRDLARIVKIEVFRLDRDPVLDRWFWTAQGGMFLNCCGINELAAMILANVEKRQDKFDLIVRYLKENLDET